jgi:hypothetical protein
MAEKNTEAVSPADSNSTGKTDAEAQVVPLEKTLSLKEGQTREDLDEAGIWLREHNYSPSYLQ